MLTITFHSKGGLIKTTELNANGLASDRFLPAILNDFYEMATTSRIVPKAVAIISSNQIVNIHQFHSYCIHL